MNLNSPLLQFQGATSGTLTVQVTFDEGQTYQTAYSAQVASLDGTYTLDLVPILASYFHPSLQSLSTPHNVLMFTVHLGSTLVAQDTFLYSNNNTCDNSYITKHFNFLYPFPITQYTPLSITINGITQTFDWQDTPINRIFQVAQSQSPELVIGSDTFSYLCSDYQIDYINAQGVWSFFIPKGNIYRNDSVQESTFRGYQSISSSTYKVNGTYKKVLTPSFSINSGWLTENEANELSISLLESPCIYLHAPGFSNPIPVKVDSSSIKFIRPTSSPVMNYEFTLVSNNPLTKY